MSENLKYEIVLNPDTGETQKGVSIQGTIDVFIFVCVISGSPVMGFVIMLMLPQVDCTLLLTFQLLVEGEKEKILKMD